MKTPRDLLHQHLLTPRKSLGQNFLRHPHIADEIVRRAGIAPGDTIIEVGVGLGALTMALARTAEKVIGLEIDQGLIALHEAEQDLPANVELRRQDILRTDLAALAADVGRPLHVISNLPYSISHPFLFLVLDNRQHIRQVTVMVQEEVAARLMAQPRTKEYGIATVLFALCARIESLLAVSPEMFHPEPAVQSRLIQITFAPETAPSASEFAMVKKIVRHTFGNRRKTLGNTLGTAGFWQQFPEIRPENGKALANDLLRQAEIGDKARPEELAPEEFIRLSQALGKMVAESCA
ncbi:MAG: 16S rRNA (adenine(1518)-N(6)/adenine(1519)-N(6))-dimethyltransferase RsmA [Desulfobulbaceae bacterium]|jgi:16S rRNA (adenine1518-N6/adenine1519-N6)-dimethyltransferase|nr:16S rRNA (adenine(1518)-N(6)/adenine(1519)-N(6))-dimethyltransferase RsmA [Desulfobulbaceae bacterium]